MGLPVREIKTRATHVEALFGRLLDGGSIPPASILRRSQRRAVQNAIRSFSEGFLTNLAK